MLDYVELLVRFDFFEKNLEEDFVDVLDRIGGYVGSETEDLSEWDRFEVEGGVGAVRIEVDGDEVPEDYEIK